MAPRWRSWISQSGVREGSTENMEKSENAWGGIIELSIFTINSYHSLHAASHATNTICAISSFFFKRAAQYVEWILSYFTEALSHLIFQILVLKSAFFFKCKHSHQSIQHMQWKWQVVIIFRDLYRGVDKMSWVWGHSKQQPCYEYACVLFNVFFSKYRPLCVFKSVLAHVCMWLLLFAIAVFSSLTFSSFLRLFSLISQLQQRLRPMHQQFVQRLSGPLYFCYLIEIVGPYSLKWLTCAAILSCVTCGDHGSAENITTEKVTLKPCESAALWVNNLLIRASHWPIMAFCSLQSSPPASTRNSNPHMVDFTTRCANDGKLEMCIRHFVSP